MYRNILVSVDGSATSDLALQEAVLLAKDQKATLRILHVVDLSPASAAMDADATMGGSDLFNEVSDALRAAGQKILEASAQKARAAGIEPETSERTVEPFNNRIWDAIEEEAEKWPADLVVIGTHGRRGFRRLVLGSVAEGLVRITSKPVLLIRAKEST